MPLAGGSQVAASPAPFAEFVGRGREPRAVLEAVGAHDDRARRFHVIEQLRAAEQRRVQEHLAWPRVRGEAGGDAADLGGAGDVDEHEVHVRDEPGIREVERADGVPGALEVVGEPARVADRAGQECRRH